MTEAVVNNVQQTFIEIIIDLKLTKTNLSEKMLQITRKRAYAILTNTGRGSEILNLLTKLQEIHGLILAMHPETVYAEDFKFRENTIYNKLIDKSEENSRLINSCLDIFQYIKGELPRYVASEEYCYNLLTSQSSNGLSFWGHILRILSNSETIISYLKSISVAEEKKGELSRDRMLGMRNKLGRRGEDRLTEGIVIGEPPSNELPPLSMELPKEEEGTQPITMSLKKGDIEKNESEALEAKEEKKDGK